MKKLFYISCIVSLFFTVSQDVGAGKKKKVGDSKEYKGIAAVVNEDVITSKDLDDRVKMILFSAGGNVTPESEEEIKKEVLKEMISEILKWQCAKKYAPKSGWVSETDVQSMFSEIAKRNNMDSETFSKLLERNKIDKNLILRQIKINLSWIQYIKARFGGSINISNSEIKRMVTEIKEKRNKQSFYVYKMFFPVSDQASESSVLSHVNNLNQMLARGADFSTIARQFSKDPNANKGGEFGWIYQGQLSEEEDSVLKKMAVGSRAIVRNSRGYVILFLRDKREAGLDTSFDLKFVQVVVPFSNPHPTNDEVNKLMEYINNMKNTSRNCHEMIVQARDSGLCGVSEPTAMNLENMRPEMRPIISEIPAGGMGKPIVTDNGIVVLCVIDKQVHKIQDPSPDDLRTQKMDERLSVSAEQELQNLRKKSDIK